MSCASRKRGEPLTAPHAAAIYPLPAHHRLPAIPAPCGSLLHHHHQLVQHHVIPACIAELQDSAGTGLEDWSNHLQFHAARSGGASPHLI